MEEDGLEWHIGGYEQEGDLLILNQAWGIDGDIDEGARNYLEVANTPFSVGSTQQVVIAGNKLVSKYDDDVRAAERQAHQLHMRSIAPQAHNSRMLLRKRPEQGGGKSRV